MAKKSSMKKGNMGIGVGVTAALVSAAGAYFLYGAENAAKNRKMVKSWTLKAKAEVLEGLEKAKAMSKEDYEQLIDKSVKTYSRLKGASAGEVAGFAREMKAHWKGLEKRGEAKLKTSQVVARKMVRKAVKAATKVAPMVVGKEVAKKSAKSAKKGAKK